MTCPSGGNKTVRCLCSVRFACRTKGFLSYTAKYGCSYCKKAFLGGFGNKDYSGFDRDMWPKRTGDAHRKELTGLKLKKAKLNLN